MDSRMANDKDFMRTDRECLIIITLWVIIIPFLVHDHQSAHVYFISTSCASQIPPVRVYAKTLVWPFRLFALADWCTGGTADYNQRCAWKFRVNKRIKRVCTVSLHNASWISACLGKLLNWMNLKVRISRWNIQVLFQNQKYLPRIRNTSFFRRYG